MGWPSRMEKREGVGPEAAEPVQPVIVPIQKPAAEGGTETATTQRAPRFVIWSHRLSLVVFVVFCIELGMLLAILPWTAVWNQNSFISIYPTFKAFLQNNFVRGLATGMGLVDIWIGIWEAVHYRDPVK